MNEAFLKKYYPKEYEEELAAKARKKQQQLLENQPPVSQLADPKIQAGVERMRAQQTFPSREALEKQAESVMEQRGGDPDD